MADLAPADAVVYVEAELPAEGERSAALAAALERFGLSEREVSGRLRRAIDDALASDLPGSGLSFARDFEPWLGTGAGFFVLGPDGESGALLVETTDVEDARATLERAFAARTDGAPLRARQRGVEYLLTPSNEAAAVVDGVLAFGDEAGVKAAIDTALGGRAAIAESDPWSDLAEHTEGQPLIRALFDNAAFRASLALPGETALVADRGAAFPELRAGLLAADGEAGAGEEHGVRTAVGAYLDPDALTVESVTTGSGVLIDTPPSLMLGGVPADALVAFTVVGFGEAARAGFSEGLRSTGLDPRTARGLLLGRLGFDPLRLLGALDEAAFYLRGAGGGRFSAAAVVRVENEDAVAAAIAGLRARLRREPGIIVVPAPPSARTPTDGFMVLAPSLPAPLVVALAGEPGVRRLVIGAGPGIPVAAVEPDKPLSGSPRRDRLAAVLGEGFELAMFADLPALTRSLRELPSARDDREVLSRLRRLGLLVAGSAEVEGADLGRLVLELD